MPGIREEIDAAVAAAPDRDRLIVMRGADLRTVAHRPPAGEHSAALLLVVGLPDDAGDPRPSVRPNPPHPSFREHPARARHAIKRSHDERAAEVAPGRTSAPQGATDAAERPSASAAGDDGPTQRDVIPI
jgi:hypothetical protein